MCTHPQNMSVRTDTCILAQFTLRSCIFVRTYVYACARTFARTQKRACAQLRWRRLSPCKDLTASCVFARRHVVGCTRMCVHTISCESTHRNMRGPQTLLCEIHMCVCRLRSGPCSSVPLCAHTHTRTHVLGRTSMHVVLRRRFLHGTSCVLKWPPC